MRIEQGMLDLHAQFSWACQLITRTDGLIEFSFLGKLTHPVNPSHYNFVDDQLQLRSRGPKEIWKNLKKIETHRRHQTRLIPLNTTLIGGKLSEKTQVFTLGLSPQFQPTQVNRINCGFVFWSAQPSSYTRWLPALVTLAGHTGKQDLWKPW